MAEKQATATDVDATAEQAFRAGDYSKALGYISLGAMGFPERKEFWRARWREIAAANRADKEMGQ